MGRYWGQLMHFLEAIYAIKFVKVKYELEYYTKEIFGYFQKKFKQFHISMGYEYVLVTVFLFSTWVEAIIW